MNAISNPKRRTGVVCMFCGLKTPVSDLIGDRYADCQITASIIRCGKCGKEAPYLQNQFVDYDAPNIRGRAAGMG